MLKLSSNVDESKPLDGGSLLVLCDEGGEEAMGRALHLSTFRLNLCRFGHTSPCPPV